MLKKLAPALSMAALVAVGGVGLIQQYEGKRNATYLDPVGIPTICYGHTGPDVTPGLRLNDAECNSLLDRDIMSHNAVLNTCLTVPVSYYQRAALISFTFNVGGKRACASTLIRKLNAGDVQGAADEFPKWIYAGGVPLQGLKSRRLAERQLFLSTASPADPKALLAPEMKAAVRYTVTQGGTQ